MGSIKAVHFNPALDHAIHSWVFGFPDDTKTRFQLQEIKTALLESLE